MKVTIVGLDIAKNIFHVVCFDERFKELRKRMLRRNQVLLYFANLPVCCIGMEACASSHYWGRELMKLGHEVKLIPPQHVKAYLRGNKNDYNDARAIAEAATRPGISGWLSRQLKNRICRPCTAYAPNACEIAPH